MALDALFLFLIGILGAASFLILDKLLALLGALIQWVGKITGGESNKEHK